jgi:general nucleoside transport system permease protein
MSGFAEVALLLTAPLLLAATGELLLERAGSIQIGVEGTMLAGAFCAFAVALRTGEPHLGLIAGAFVGAASGGLFAFFAVARRADPILVGTAWNLLAFGATAFAFRLLAGETGASLQVRALPRAAGGLPAAAWIAFLLPFLLQLFLTRTRAGLLVVAAGENPLALRALGRSVVAVRTSASLVAGALAGLAGALLVGTVSPTFVEGVTAGRGFLALAIVVFTRWEPLGLVPASLLVGGATALQYQLQARGTTVPYAFFLALPALVALGALAFGRGSRAAPKALGQPAP